MGQRAFPGDHLHVRTTIEHYCCQTATTRQQTIESFRTWVAWRRGIRTVSANPDVHAVIPIRLWRLGAPPETIQEAIRQQFESGTPDCGSLPAAFPGAGSLHHQVSWSARCKVPRQHQQLRRVDPH
jgi:hypothetical protein